jgi:hypothetical protein
MRVGTIFNEMNCFACRREGWMKCRGLGSFSAGLELTSLRAGFSWAALREVTSFRAGNARASMLEAMP